MAERRGRRTPNVTTAEVLRTEQVTPHMIRVVLGGEGLAGFECGDYTDHYLKLQFPVEGVAYPEPFDLARIREELPREQWPVTRTYTVRRWDAAARELWIDFVYHGDEGVAGPWAANAKPGTLLRFAGPGGGYAPDAGSDWHLLVGDESALPAISSAVERLAPGARAHVFVEVEGHDEEQQFKSAGDLRVTWLHRGADRVGERLVEAVRGFEFPGGTVQAFVHGEAGFVREIRRHLRFDHGVPRERLSISGYWRLGHNEDGWQSSKPEWNKVDEVEEAEAAN
ncbi:siderophore-interacting protein [Glycomyces harbinensis]|uniref:NADPH-dependent ferric siderophore reductase, contains FAD-binding and SIP domains n=1 Tax=Glycomyces harbinensis TaxID=58114 RepID=A0A1G6YUC2_9ACTN|nr:siderophore-interacting protein [Glycomyces harbinensis]SDD93247.1 NADPH-dependent ferric siderophore reductase, contains FAD-binding and SIP domains [Glycomyces harbinensis]